MRRKRPTFTLLAACAVLALAGAAGGADGDPYLKSCHSTIAAAPCVQLEPPFAAADAELSPDGRHLYAVLRPNGGGSNGLRLFDVGTAGTLTARALNALPGQGGDVDLSPDGRHVYVGAGAELRVFNRDAATGALTLFQTATGPSSFTAAAVSPDGRNLYARSPSQLTVFDRDPASGALTQKPAAAGCFVEELALASCSSAVGIAGDSNELAVSSDGRHLYVTNQTPGGVALFNRQADGTLSQPRGTDGGCITVGGTSGSTGGAECVPGSPTLSQAAAVNLDIRGEFVVVSAAGGNTLFRRDAAAGGLTQTDCLDELGGGAPPTGCHEVKGAAGSDAAVSPDGQSVALNASAFGLSAFSLDRTTGKLAQRPSRGCFSASVGAPCEHVPGLVGGLGSVAFSPNGLNLFTAHRGGALAVFGVDVAPACQSKTASVPRNTRVFVPLACTDANGDQVTIQITAPPPNGSLGIVDQKRKRVSYTPDIDYRGRDVFQYRGTARGTRGKPAIVRITVLARGRRIDRKPPNTRIKSGPPKTTASRTALFRFAATERGSRFECKLDKQRWARCKSPKRYPQVRHGKHTFQVRAVDRAGNTDLSPAKRSWIRGRS